MNSRSFRERSTADAGSPPEEIAVNEGFFLAPFSIGTALLAIWIGSPTGSD